MNMVELIIKKRNGGTLTKEEIEWFVQAYTDGQIPDYQVSALLMAIYYQHLDEEETQTLTKAMQDSGGKILCCPALGGGLWVDVSDVDMLVNIARKHAE